jgi:hypothetical protein
MFQKATGSPDGCVEEACDTVIAGGYAPTLHANKRAMLF